MDRAGYIGFVRQIYSYAMLFAKELLYDKLNLKLIIAIYRCFASVCCLCLRFIYVFNIPLDVGQLD